MRHITPLLECLPALSTATASRAAAALALALACTGGAAQTSATPAESQPANEQVVVPQVERRELRLPRFPSKDYELGLLYGTYATQNFGSKPVVALRLGYHITEDFFVESVYGRTKADDSVYRRLLATGGGVFDTETVNLSYYNISFGFNALPGEVFLGARLARPTALYLIGGVGSTKFDKQRRQTVNFGWGVRSMLADWAALQLDMRDHVFTLDLLGKRENTHNIEMSAGLTFFF
ncbi:MAG: outer membrane beta-barrel domain-containing protein [Burkholderiaceae bacterium]